MPLTTLRRAGLLVTSVLLAATIEAEPVDFRLPDLQGREVHLADFRGRWVVINFWASWCAPCIAEIPVFIAFQEAHPEVQVIGINFEESSAAETTAFLRRFAINYPNLIIGTSPLVPFEPLDGLPTTVFVTPAGELAEHHLGQVSLHLLEATIARPTPDHPPSASTVSHAPATDAPTTPAPR